MRAFINQYADKRIIDGLYKQGFDIVLLPPFDALCPPVSTHADMLICYVESSMFIHKDYPLDMSAFANITRIDEPISQKYPNDVLMNIAIVGKNVFANTNHASKTILEHLKTNGYSICHISQGYAHCSTCIVSDNAIITADDIIAREAVRIGIDTLKISSGHVSLPPYEYGFIGGATGVTEDAVYFCGSLSYHPDGAKIQEFIKAHRKEVLELIDGPLMDVGGILFI